MRRDFWFWVMTATIPGNIAIYIIFANIWSLFALAMTTYLVIDHFRMEKQYGKR